MVRSATVPDLRRFRTIGLLPQSQSGSPGDDPSRFRPRGPWVFPGPRRPVRQESVTPSGACRPGEGSSPRGGRRCEPVGVCPRSNHRRRRRLDLREGDHGVAHARRQHRWARWPRPETGEAGHLFTGETEVFEALFALVLLGLLCVEVIEMLEKCNQPHAWAVQGIHLESQDTPRCQEPAGEFGDGREQTRGVSGRRYRGHLEGEDDR